MRRILVLLSTMVAGVLLASGVALATTVAEQEPNDTRATAQNIDDKFSLDADANITNSTTVPHASVDGTGNDTLDFYSFTVSQAGTTGTFDIDSTAGGDPVFGYDSYLRLFDSSGTVLAVSDDSAVDPGSTDDSEGLGGTFDSYLTYTFSTPGTYYIEVGQCCKIVGDTLEPFPVPNTATYQLHVSIANPPLADTTPPFVAEGSPGDLETGVATTANVTATFSEQVQGVSSSTFKLERVVVNKKGVERLRAVRAQVSTVLFGSGAAAATQATLDPARDLKSGSYQATVTTGVTDLVGNPLDQDSGQAGNQPMVWRFTVGSPPV